MNTLYKIYFLLPHDSKFGIVSKIINRIAARIIKRAIDYFYPEYLKRTAKSAGMGININENRNKKYIVSLTSFPARINDVWISIETIFRQSFKPDKVILWLSEKQFEGQKLPQNLLNLVDRGLTIRYVNEDLRSHKKYIYAIEEFPNDYIITLDDDLYYEKNLILNLVNLKKEYPEYVPTNRAHKIKITDNIIEPYRKWFHNATDIAPSNLLVQTGGNGTLYCKNDLFKDFNSVQIIKELAPYADDIWLKIMVLKAQKKIVTNIKYNKDPLVVKATQNEKLVTQNVINGGNDTQFNNLLKHYQLSAKDFTDAI